MKRIPRLAGLGLVLLLITPLATVMAEPGEPTATVKQVPMSQDQAWRLLRGSGAELYQQLCSSCHGLDGTGNLTAAKALALPPPDLTQLTALGIPKEHVGYVLRSSCDDAHHRAPDGSATMPCWDRIIRHTVRSDAMAMPILNRLVEYVDSLQVDEAAG